MDINNLVTTLKNKATALEAKKQVSIERGSLDLAEVFNKELIDTEHTIASITRGLDRESIDKVISDIRTEWVEIKLETDAMKHYIELENAAAVEFHKQTSNAIEDMRKHLDEIKEEFDTRLGIQMVYAQDRLNAITNFYSGEIDKLNKRLEMYTMGNRFARAWKVLIGKM
jgi:type I site-specific restriction endonuclease